MGRPAVLKGICAKCVKHFSDKEGEEKNAVGLPDY